MAVTEKSGGQRPLTIRFPASCGGLPGKLGEEGTGKMGKMLIHVLVGAALAAGLSGFSHSAVGPHKPAYQQRPLSLLRS